MIQIHVNPAGVEKVLFASNSKMEEDFDLAAWQAIRPFVDKIDQKLRGVIEDLRRADNE